MNTNYKKNFVPYKQALALKKLGFYEPCFQVYDAKGFLQEEKTMDELMLEKIAAPLYQQAFRWFREKYNIDAWVQPFVSEKQNGKPFLPDESYAYYIFEDGVYVADGVNFLDSEEAELECLKKLIEIAKKQL